MTPIQRKKESFVFFFDRLRSQQREKSSPKEWGPKQFERALNLLKIPHISQLEHHYKIGCYFPIRGELNLAQFAQPHWLFPKVLKEKRELVWFEYGDGKQNYITGSYGIPEKPDDKCYELAHFQKPMICFVPGLAASMQGDRLGYGGGFYDDFLSKNQDKVTSIFCLPSKDFILDSLPIEKLDCKVDLLVF